MLRLLDSIGKLLTTVLNSCMPTYRGDKDYLIPLDRLGKYQKDDEKVFPVGCWLVESHVVILGNFAAGNFFTAVGSDVGDAAALGGDDANAAVTAADRAVVAKDESSVEDLHAHHVGVAGRIWAVLGCNSMAGGS